MGLAGGLVALMRLPDVTYLALPLVDGLMVTKSKTGPSLRSKVTGILAYESAALLVFIPQMAVWQVLYGSPLISGYLYRDQITFFCLAPHVIQVLFSPLHGLYIWHPVLLFATAGIAVLYRHDSRLALLLALGLAMQVYVIGAWQYWSQGDAFGGRMFISSLPGLALGLGALLERVIARGMLSTVGLMSIGFIIWNGLLLLQYRLGYIAMNAPLTLEQFMVGKLRMIVDLWHRLINLSFS